jgi:electron transfer flavoprotein alpha subunit
VKSLTSVESDIWVFSERKDVAFELLAKARELASDLGGVVCALALGTEPEQDSETLLKHGADRVLLVKSPALRDSLPEPFAEAIARLASERRPAVLLIGSTKKGKDIAARTAARLQTGVMTDCVELRVDSEKRQLVVERPSYGGVLVSTEVCTTRPQVATVPPRVFEAANAQGGSPGEVVRVEIELTPPKTRVVEVAPKEAKGVKLEEAQVIVAGGRGVAKREDFRILEELAHTLGGEVGCSSPIAEDLKWQPLERLIGLSGCKVKPRLYVACGISGQAQHVTGMRGSRIVVAVDSDPEAPIFQQSDYFVVGDLYEVVPALTEAFRRILQK